jgi:hypothetical protein
MPFKAHSSSAIRHAFQGPFVIRHPPSAIRHPPSAMLLGAFRHPPSAMLLGCVNLVARRTFIGLKLSVVICNSKAESERLTLGNI